MSADTAGAHHVASRLMRELLMDKKLIAATESPVRAILPNLNVIQIGGLSIMDRGHAAVLPLLEEIVREPETPCPDHRRRSRRARPAHPVGRTGSRLADRRAGDAGRQVFRPERLTWCRACWRTTDLSIWRRRSSSNCCPVQAHRYRHERLDHRPRSRSSCRPGPRRTTPARHHEEHQRGRSQHPGGITSINVHANLR